MLNTIRKTLATIIVVLAVIMTVVNWNTALGVVWLIAGIGWLNVLIDGFGNERVQSNS
jgi:hypothetical protein